MRWGPPTSEDRRRRKGAGRRRDEGALIGSLTNPAVCLEYWIRLRLRSPSLRPSSQRSLSPDGRRRSGLGCTISLRAAWVSLSFDRCLTEAQRATHREAASSHALDTATINTILLHDGALDHLSLVSSREGLALSRARHGNQAFVYFTRALLFRPTPCAKCSPGLPAGDRRKRRPGDAEAALLCDPEAVESPSKQPARTERPSSANFGWPCKTTDNVLKMLLFLTFKIPPAVAGRMRKITSALYTTSCPIT